MSKEMMAVIGFGIIGTIALVMLLLERRGIAKRKAARGGREIDISDIVAFGAPGANTDKSGNK